MDNQHIARLEAQLEQLVEGVFANLFGKRIRAQDIALQLARALEDGVKTASGSDPRLIAPDQYAIYVHPKVQASLLKNHPELQSVLAQHLVELATLSGYRLIGNPLVKILADPTLDSAKLLVAASHSNLNASSTEALQRVVLPEQTEKPLNAQLIVGEGRVVRIDGDVVNIGRGRHNHVVIDDPHVSRHHIQLRLRFGAYMLFDVDSQGGTFVNDVRVREHRLRSGDVIHIGTTRMLYMEDDPLGDSPTGQTEAFDPIH